jgi:hypothetical protein
MNAATITALVIISILFGSLMVYFSFRDRRDKSRQTRWMPRTSSENAVTPRRKDAMVPGTEYCWISFNGENRQTTVTYYSLDSERKEQFEDNGGLLSREIGERLMDEGWQFVTRISHHEGHEYYFDRVTR